MAKTRLNKTNREILRTFANEQLKKWFKDKLRKLPLYDKSMAEMKRLVDEKWPESEMAVISKWGKGSVLSNLEVHLHYDNMDKVAAKTLHDETVVAAKLSNVSFGAHNGVSPYSKLEITSFGTLFFKKTSPNHGWETLNLKARSANDGSFITIASYLADCSRLEKEKVSLENDYYLAISSAQTFEDLMEVWPEIVVLSSKMGVQEPKKNLPAYRDEELIKRIRKNMEERGVPFTSDMKSA